MLRGLALRCPACGRASVAERPFRIRHHCPACSALFKREEGFFVGAVAINLVTTELLVLALYGAALLLGVSNFERLIAALVVSALVLPAVLYHHSWALWLSLDHVVESLPRYEGGTGDGG
jgi:uncharacterized protein (DUF983 family)